MRHARKDGAETSHARMGVAHTFHEARMDVLCSPCMRHVRMDEDHTFHEARMDVAGTELL